MSIPLGAGKVLSAKPDHRQPDQGREERVDDQRWRIDVDGEACDDVRNHIHPHHLPPTLTSRPSRWLSDLWFALTANLWGVGCQGESECVDGERWRINVDGEARDDV